MQILDHPYSFFAIREGASLPSDTISLQKYLTGRATASLVITLEDATDRYKLDGVATSAADLARTLADRAKRHPTESVLIRAAESVPFERVYRASRLIRDAGITSIQIGPLAD